VKRPLEAALAKAKNRSKQSTASGQRGKKPTAQESAQRMQEFANRKENFIAAVRKGKD